jgi:hypothetical protein
VSSGAGWEQKLLLFRRRPALRAGNFCIIKAQKQTLKAIKFQRKVAATTAPNNMHNNESFGILTTSIVCHHCIW